MVLSIVYGCDICNQPITDIDKEIYEKIIVDENYMDCMEDMFIVCNNCIEKYKDAEVLIFNKQGVDLIDNQYTWNYLGVLKENQNKIAEKLKDYEYFFTVSFHIMHKALSLFFCSLLFEEEIEYNVALNVDDINLILSKITEDILQNTNQEEDSE